MFRGDFNTHLSLSIFPALFFLPALRTSPLVKHHEARICHVYERHIFCDEDFMRNGLSLSLWRYHGKALVSDGNTTVCYSYISYIVYMVLSCYTVKDIEAYTSICFETFHTEIDGRLNFANYKEMESDTLN